MSAKDLFLLGYQAVPFRKPGNYDEKLKENGIKPEHKVKISLHHVIPNSILRDFFNSILINQHLSEIKEALSAIEKNIKKWEKITEQSYKTGISVTKALATEMKDGKIKHGYKQDRVIEGEPRVDSFGMFWCNIPKEPSE